MAAKKITIEESFLSLEEMIKQLESPNVSLEDSFRIYKEGMKLLKTCNASIDKVEKSMQLLNENGELSEF